MVMPRPALLTALLLSFTASAWSQAVDLLVYPNGGIFDIDKQGGIGGPGAALVARLQSASDVQLNPQVMPIARALQTIAQLPNTCLVGLPRTPDRELDFRWAGPWASTSIALYGRAGEQRHVDGPQDLRGARIAVLRQSIPAAWLKEQGLTSQQVNDAAAGLRMLQAGRVDYWLGSDMATRLVIKTIPGPAPRVLYRFGRIDLYMACQLSTPAALVERLHIGLQQLRRNGDLAEFGLR